MSEQPNNHEQQKIDGMAEARRRIEAARREGPTTLDLSGLELTRLPEEISQLTQLQRLDLSNNRLVTLPDTISQLTQLKQLYLDDNQLAALPDSISQLVQLLSLGLANNQFTTLPESVSQLAQLLLLGLASNQFTTLPESISQLAQLQVLYLYKNHLTILPDTFDQLTQLQELYLSLNQFTTLPDTIIQLTQLQKLDLAYNQLTVLPDTLRKLGSLEQLYLHGNDALGLPTEVLGPIWSKVVLDKATPAKATDILDYYFRTRGGKHPLNEAKLILVGRGGVGKTSLVNQLVYNKFEREEKKTEGIKITEWPLRLNGKEDVRLNMWDFGGQEIMHATHQFFLTQRSLYLLVLNGRGGGEDADAEYWLKLIESFGGDSPVIVVLNKINEHAFDVNRRALQQKYPNIREFVKTDCADGLGIKELNKAIERETDRLEHLRDAFPASWFEIKYRLGGMKKNYVSFDEFRRFCKKHGEKEPEAQEALAGYLHNLGVVLNYKDDPRLQDTHVLSPHWVTDGIYKILNSPKLEQQKGEIRLNDLSKVLDARKYPPQMRRFIFDLMRKFDLCFSFPDDDTHYLIPELLDKQEPPETADFASGECLNFQYHYPILPEGLLPRFIVRTHTLSEGLPRWRTGAILQFEGNRALVKADVQDKKVFISVSDPLAGRRRLLAAIRIEFERIHRDIRNLQPQEMIPLPKHPHVVVSYQKLRVMEDRGVSTFPEVVGDQVIDVDVRALLNGVDLDNVRRRDHGIERRRQAVRLFISYSHKDERLREELETHLKLLQRQGLIDTWQDRRIEAGDDWKRQIDDNLERADIILLLVSADFIASDYCYEKEMGRALERHHNREARVIPVIVRDVDWKRAAFAELHVLPKDGLAVTKWADKDSAWSNVAQGIEKVVKEMLDTTR